ncbi:hypothetical protein ACP70R_048829 [Stipagrostis hirtigluma subsp. patula]
MLSIEDSFIVPGSLNPPVLAAPDAASSWGRPGSAPWVILDELAYIGDRKNGTFAQAITRTGHAVGVSFWLADPPAMSHLCIHCSGVKVIHLIEEPVVVCSGKDIAVIRVTYNTGARSVQTMEDLAVPDCDYLVYRAHTGTPSLDVLPNPKPYFFESCEVGFLPCGDGGDFLMAVLRTRCVGLQYDLHIFSSKTNTWTKRLALLEPPSPRYEEELLVHDTGKVIAIEGGVMGWVDLWRGILMCDVLDTNPVVRYFQFPKPMDGNMSQFLQTPPRAIRDVTCSDGFIKLVEIEDQKSLVATARSSSSPRDRAVMIGYGLEIEATESYTPDGWTAVTWNRKLSWNQWRQDCTAHVNGGSILAELGHNHSESLALTNLEMAGPVWSMNGGDVVYLMAKTSLKDKNAWAISLNMRKCKLEGVTSFPAERRAFFKLECHPFALSKYVNMAPYDCKAAAGYQIQETGHSKNDPKNAMVRLTDLDPCVTVNELKDIVALFGELSYLKIHADEGYGLVEFVSRSCAEQAIRSLDRVKIGGKIVRLSWWSGNLNKQTPRRRLSEHNGANYHPYAYRYGIRSDISTAARGDDAHLVDRFPGDGHDLRQLMQSPIPTSVAVAHCSTGGSSTPPLQLPFVAANYSTHQEPCN